MYKRFFISLVFCFLSSCSLFENNYYGSNPSDSLTQDGSTKDHPQGDESAGSELPKSSAGKDNASLLQSKQVESKASNQQSLAAQSPEITDIYASYDFSGYKVTKPSESEIKEIYQLRHDKNQLKADFLVINAAGELHFYDSKEEYLKARLVTKIKEGFSGSALSAGSLLLAASYTDGVGIYDILQNKKIYSLSRLNTRSTFLDFAPDGKSLLIAGVDAVIYRWQFELEQKSETIIDSEKSLERYIGHPSVVNQVRFHNYGRIFISTDWGGSLSAWMLYDQDRYAGKYDENLFLGRFFSESVNRINGGRVASTIVEETEFSADGQYLFLADETGIIEIWGMRGFKQLASLQAHRGIIYDITFNTRKNTLVSIGRDGKLKVWKMVVKETKVPGIKEYILEPLKEMLLTDTGAGAAHRVEFSDQDKVILGTAEGQIKEISLGIQ